MMALRGRSRPSHGALPVINIVGGKRESGKGQTTLATNDGLTDRRLAPGFQFSANSSNGSYKSWISGYIQDERGFIYQGRARCKLRCG
jgi:hypothetical protein